jgi:HlyD family secretion protein
MTVIRGILTTWPGRLFAIALAGILAGGAVVASRVGAQPLKAELRTQAVTRTAITQSVSVAGSIAAQSQTKMSFKTNGKISAVYVSVGQQVTAGQALAKLDTTDLEAALAQAQSNLTTAQNNYNRAAASVADAQRSLDQSRDQAAQDLASTQSALAKLQTNYANAKTNVTSWAGAIYTDLGTYQTVLNGLKAQIDTTMDHLVISGTPEAKSAQTALNGAYVPLSNAQNFQLTMLSPALDDYLHAREGLTLAAAQFDSALAAGADTGSTVTAFQGTMTAYTNAASRLSSAIDLVNGPLASVSSSISAAQAALSTVNSRGNIVYDQWRAELTALLTSVTNEQQLANTDKSKITQANTAANTMSDAVNGSLSTAMQNISSVQTRSSQTIQTAQTALANKPYDLANAQASVDNANTALQNAQANLTAAVVTAPSAGVVSAISSQVGETAANPFMVLSNTSAIVLHGTVGESEVAKLKLGQVANVTVDAVGATTRMTGKVTSIDPVATIQQGVPVYGVDVTIDLPSAQVKPGMTGTAAVVLASKQGVLAVPNLAIRSSGGRRYVQVMKDGEAVDTDVTFGISNDTLTEVVSGLAEGDLVVLPQSRATGTQRPANFGPGGPGGGQQVIIGK